MHKQRKMVVNLMVATLVFGISLFASKPASAGNLNLVSNSGFEQGAGSVPTGWFKGNWGNNTAVFSYPVEGKSGNAVKVEMSKYTNGDAKWYFKDVAVKEGEKYEFSDVYKSSAESEIVVRFTDNKGVEDYQWLVNLQPEDSWKTLSVQITPPAGTKTLTVFHSIVGTGFLLIDDVAIQSVIDAEKKETPTALVEETKAPVVSPTVVVTPTPTPTPSAVPTPTPTVTTTPTPTPTVVPVEKGTETPKQTGEKFDKGYVSLTFDDGWISQFTDARQVLKENGLNAGFYIINKRLELSANANLVPNAELEKQAGSKPQNWNSSKWGQNEAEFSYPVKGVEGNKAVEITMKNFSSGDAKWYFDDVKVGSGQVLSLHHSYKSTAPTKVVARFVNSNGTNTYVGLANLPSSPTWQMFSGQVTVPQGAVSLTVFHLIDAVGTLTLDNFYLGPKQEYMSLGQVLQLQADGFEVSSHSESHLDLATLSAKDLQFEIAESRKEYVNLGVKPADVFVYPFGSYNQQVISAVKSAGFIGARSVDRGYNLRTTNKYALQIQQVGIDTTPEQVQNWINQAKANKTWLILMFHQVDYNPEAIYGTTPDTMKKIATVVKNSQVQTINMAEGLRMMQ